MPPTSGMSLTPPYTGNKDQLFDFIGKLGCPCMRLGKFVLRSWKIMILVGWIFNASNIGNVANPALHWK